MTALILSTLLQLITEVLPISSSSHTWLIQKKMAATINRWFIDILHLPTAFIVCIWILQSTDISLIGFIILMIQLACVNSITLAFSVFFSYFSFRLPMSVGLLCSSGLLFFTYYYRILFLTQPIIPLEYIPLRSWLLVSTIQGISLQPGISRLAATFCMLCIYGYHPQTSIEMAWALSVPLFVGAAFKELMLRKNVYTIFNRKLLAAIVIGSVCSMAFFNMSIYFLASAQTLIFSIYLVVFAGLIMWLNYGDVLNLDSQVAYSENQKSGIYEQKNE